MQRHLYEHFQLSDPRIPIKDSYPCNKCTYGTYDESVYLALVLFSY